MSHAIDNRKIAIIGTGMVGSTIAYTLMEQGLFSEIVLVNAHRERAEGEAMDINHAMTFLSPMNIYAGDYDDIVDASIIIVTAGAGQKVGETRLDLVRKNAAILGGIIPEIARRDYQGILLIVSNPVDILTHVALKLSGFPRCRVFGSGTVLDTARLKYLIGEHLDVDYRGVQSYIIGEHGDSEIPVWSSTCVSGIPLNTFCELRGFHEHQASMQRMNEETQMVYAKYGVNPAGSCVQLAIQMLILFPLYRVIMNIPAYVGQVKDVFTQLASQLLNTAGAEDYLKEIASSIQATTISKSFTENTIIDPDNWTALAEKFPDLKDVISSTSNTIGKMNNFLGLNIANTPMNYIKEHASVWLVIGAILVPVLAALTQWVSVKISMAGNPQTEGSDQMAGTMKTMNNIMPLMSAFFCLTLPVGMGIYWIMSAVVRMVQTFFINRNLEKQDMEEILRKNIEKNKKKMEKKGGVSGAQIAQNAAINTRKVNTEVSRAKRMQNAAVGLDESAVSKKANVRPGSLAEKANMVAEYNEKHKKK